MQEEIEHSLAGYRPLPRRSEAAIARDPVSRSKTTYLNDPHPSCATYGPRSRQEVMQLIDERGGLPV